MEIIDDNNKDKKKDPSHDDSFYEWHRKRSKTGRVLGGILIVAVGAVLLANRLGIAVPEWILSWPVLIIVLGIFVGVRHNFRNAGWFILMLIGGLFLLDEITPELKFQDYIWPIIIILAGLMMIIKPFRKNHWYHHHRRNWNMEEWKRNRYQPRHMNYEAEPADLSSENRIESVSIFGHIKKNVITKNFKGGDVVCIFGGAEINLSQADISGKVVLEMVQVFGGTKLVVPSNWDVKQEIVAVLGGIDDKRKELNNISASNDKVLVLRGTAIFGGIDIKSY